MLPSASPDSLNHLFCSLVLGVLAYIFGGMAWNYKQKEARGIEMFPNLEFWQASQQIDHLAHTFRHKFNGEFD